MKVLLAVGLVAVASAVVSTEVLAGNKVPKDVVIDKRRREAHGGMGTARNSTSVIEQIGCSVGSFAGSSTLYVGCQAYNYDGESLYCYTSDLHYPAIVAGIADSSMIWFAADAAGKCT